MKLLTKEIQRRLPKMYSSEELPIGEHVAVCKFFNPCGAYTFYVIEGEQEEDGWRLFGFATGVDFPEFGYVMLSELQEYKGPLGLGIERDIYFNPKPLKDIPDVAKHLVDKVYE